MTMIIQLAQAIFIVAGAIIALCVATVCLYLVAIATQSIIEEHINKKKGMNKNGTKKQ